MGVTITVTDDRAEFDAVRLRLGGFDLAAMVGLHDEDEATKGYRHEVGAAGRAFMGPSFDRELPKLERTMQLEAGRVADGKATADDAIITVGEQMEDGTREYVEGAHVGGDPLSKEAKRRDPRKLIDTGDMVKSLLTKVVRASEAER